MDEEPVPQIVEGRGHILKRHSIFMKKISFFWFRPFLMKSMVNVVSP
jgi:hypothetical protein